MNFLLLEKLERPLDSKTKQKQEEGNALLILMFVSPRPRDIHKCDLISSFQPHYGINHGQVYQAVPCNL